MVKKTLVALVAAILLFTGVSFAKEEEEGLLRLDLAAGVNTALSGEEETFSFNGLTGLVHVDLLGVDFLDATSGVGLEISFGGGLEYTVWSLNRATVPGTGDAIYGGSDLKLLQSDDNEGLSRNFDLRIVTGTRVGKVGPGDLRFELYFIEENRPVSFAVVYGW